jgi:hypothetical protein
MNAVWIFYLYVLPLLIAAGAFTGGYIYSRRHKVHPGE